MEGIVTGISSTGRRLGTAAPLSERILARLAAALAKGANGTLGSFSPHGAHHLYGADRLAAARDVHIMPLRPAIRVPALQVGHRGPPVGGEGILDRLDGPLLGRGLRLAILLEERRVLGVAVGLLALFEPVVKRLLRNAAGLSCCFSVVPFAHLAQDRTLAPRCELRAHAPFSGLNLLNPPGAVGAWRAPPCALLRRFHQGLSGACTPQPVRRSGVHHPQQRHAQSRPRSAQNYR
jgi:hypothetical protein